MKERPILFNTEMVKAILDGRKWQSRRPVKIQPKHRLNGKDNFFNYREDNYSWMDEPEYIRNFCPFGQIGDQLYVRETFAPLAGKIEYRADCIGSPDDQLIGWTPSIHMPKKYARILLEITDIRVERVQDVTEEQARSEGMESLQNQAIKDYDPKVNYILLTNTEVFKILWNDLYRTWSDNPWVWVIEFKRIK